MSNIRPELLQGTNQVLSEINKKQNAKSQSIQDDNFRQMINLIHSNNMQDVVPTLPLEDIQLIAQIIELAKKIKTTQYPVKQEPVGPNEIKYVYVKTDATNSSGNSVGMSNLQRYLNTQESS